MAAKTKSKIKEENKEQETPMEEMVTDEEFDPSFSGEKEEKKKKGGVGKIIGVLILLLIVGFIVAVMGFNLLNIRDRYMRPVLQNVPLINRLFPAEEESVGQYDALSRDDLVALIQSLERDIDRKDGEIEALEGQRGEYLNELIRLREVEEQQIAFRQEKEEFDSLVALGNPSAYAEFYESISPENADILYREVVGITVNEREVKKYIQMFQNMDERSCAKVLEELMITDLDLATEILRNIDAQVAADVLGAMTAANASTIAKRMSPLDV